MANPMKTRPHLKELMTSIQLSCSGGTNSPKS